MIHRNGQKKEHRIAAVAIGRNEGDRLIECLHSVKSQLDHLIYVDSGSTDDSCSAAAEIGADVVNLDMTLPFTAARARNAGYQRALQADDGLFAVLFVDGDCTVCDGFVDQGRESLQSDDKLAIVIGRLREQHPDSSVYNRLCDMEWGKPVGPITECGGNALIKVTALVDVGGYREDLIAGEEPEMCVRMSNRGWRMECLDANMGFHDARMTKFSQWWKRTVRCGHAYAEGAALHGGGDSKHNVKQLRSILFWGMAVPVFSVACLLASLRFPWLGLLSLAWPAGWMLLVWKVYRYRLSQDDQPSHAKIYALFCVLGKLANAIGVVRYKWNRLIGRRSRIIEY